MRKPPGLWCFVIAARADEDKYILAKHTSYVANTHPTLTRMDPTAHTHSTVHGWEVL